MCVGVFPTAGLTLVAVVCLQAAPVEDRARAEQLARDGRTADAIALFSRIVDRDPRDDEARIWLARLALRLGRTSEAEAGFRAVLARRPDDVDASIGLGTALLRTNDWRGALALLEPLEERAADDADLLATLARAYRRAGDDRRALRYFERARARAPHDPDIIAGYEAAARVYGHAVVVEGWGQGGSPGLEGTSGALVMDIRVAPPFRLLAHGRVQHRSGTSDALGGAGIRWRANRASTVEVHAFGGPDNEALPERHVSAAALHYVGSLEIGADVRALAFQTSHVVAVSPIVAWDRERWRLDTRYSLSRARFDGAGDTSEDHSVFVRGTLRPQRRIALMAVYAYGIESFADLTADRLRALNATTAGTGVQFDLPSLSRLAINWEHQWRSNDTSVDRVTVTLVQVLR